MTPTKLKQLAQLLSGLKQYEWARVKRAVDMQYALMSNRLQLDDTKAIEERLLTDWSLDKPTTP